MLNKLDFKVCNCAGCRRLLLGTSMRRWFKPVLERMWGEDLPPFVYRRWDDRPYCEACFGLLYRTLPPGGGDRVAR